MNYNLQVTIATLPSGEFSYRVEFGDPLIVWETGRRPTRAMITARVADCLREFAQHEATAAATP